MQERETERMWGPGGHMGPSCDPTHLVPLAGGLDTHQPGEKAAGEGEWSVTCAEEGAPQPAWLPPAHQAAGEHSQ